MGYYTDFTIKIKGEDEDEEKKIQEYLENISGYGFDNYSKELNLNAKWYNWEDNMPDLSKTFPHVLFQIDGEGEESGDMWRVFYHKGAKEQIKVETTYSESRLKQEFDASEVIHEILTED